MEDVGLGDGEDIVRRMGWSEAEEIQVILLL